MVRNEVDSGDDDGGDDDVLFIAMTFPKVRTPSRPKLHFLTKLKGVRVSFFLPLVTSGKTVAGFFETAAGFVLQPDGFFMTRAMTGAKGFNLCSSICCVIPFRIVISGTLVAPAIAPSLV